MFELKEISHNTMIKRRNFFAPLLEEVGLNLMDVELLCFLKKYPDSNTFTKIQQSKDYAKSHVSTAISDLVEGGYICKEHMQGNKKIYYLKLLPKSEDVIAKFEIHSKRLSEITFKGIPQSEIDIFISVAKKMNENLNREIGE